MELTLTIAFIAGVVSFLAPCVLPLVPGFLAYLAGSGTGEKEPKRLEIFLNALVFVIGFALVFSVLGILLNTVLEAFAYDIQTWLSRIGGAIIIFFGLYLTGLVRVGAFEREHKMRITRKFKSRYLTSFLFGLAFAAGWTPCVGPALGAILGLAATAPGSAFSLLLAYTLGLGAPFLVVGAFAGEASRCINRYVHLIKYVNIVFGILLMALGVLIFTEQLSLIANFEFLNRFLLS